MEQTIRQLMKETGLIGNTILCLDEVDSTNTFLKRMALEGAKDGTAVLAQFQTAGRGRMARSFQSPRGKGIYLSVLLRPELSSERIACMTALAGVAVCEAVERVCGIRPGLKWPNDPVLGNRILGGILAELVIMPDGTPAAVLGIGLNVLQSETDFAPEIRSVATSVSMELGHPVVREELISELICQLERAYAALRSEDWSEWIRSYREDCVHIGKQIRLIDPNGEKTVTAIDIDETFGLIVEEEGLRRTVRAGEISVRGLFGYV
jgi:BirA family biotin operon repressor/biotin-[acetyl-CoA-carboxylase] ligase